MPNAPRRRGPRARSARVLVSFLSQRSLLSLLFSALSFLPVGALPALAAEPTTLTLDTPVPAEPRYSQAVTVVVHLARAGDASPVQGTDCTPACSVIVTVAPADDPGTSFIVNPQGFVPDSTGTATVRVPFVDGLFDDASFPASTAGAPYVIRAFFRGSGAGQIANPDCTTVDGDLCPSEDTVEVPLFAETAEIVLGAGLEGALGDTLTLSAQLSDPNGNAAAGGEDVDGAGPLELVDRTVTFFYDQDNNGRPDAAEVIDTAVTNASGVASLAFTLDAQFVRAGTYDNGIHAEFGGDGRYGVARASSPLVVRPAAVDVTRTVLEADPREIPADGFSTSTLRARLVDAFNNPLDETSDPHDVVFETDLGVLVDAVERDPENGTYAQLLRAQRKAGTATVTVIVDGTRGPTTAVEIVGGTGCHCRGAGSSSADLPAAGLAACLWLLSRRRARRLERQEDEVR